MPLVLRLRSHPMIGPGLCDMQDDEAMTQSCKWLQDAITIMQAYPSLAAIGFRRFKFTGMKYASSSQPDIYYPANLTSLGTDQTHNKNGGVHFRDRQSGIEFQFVSR